MTKNTILASLSSIVILVMVIKISYDCGNYAGIGVGVEGTLDTVNKILIKQVESDTSVTKLVLVNPDTNVYYLSRRTVLNSAK